MKILITLVYDESSHNVALKCNIDTVQWWNETTLKTTLSKIIFCGEKVRIFADFVKRFFLILIFFSWNFGYWFIFFYNCLDHMLYLITLFWQINCWKTRKLNKAKITLNKHPIVYLVFERVQSWNVFDSFWQTYQFASRWVWKVAYISFMFQCRVPETFHRWYFGQQRQQITTYQACN